MMIFAIFDSVSLARSFISYEPLLYSILSAKEMYTTPLSTCTSTSFSSSRLSERVRLFVSTILSESLLLFTSTRWRIY